MWHFNRADKQTMLHNWFYDDSQSVGQKCSSSPKFRQNPEHRQR